MEKDNKKNEDIGFVLFQEAWKRKRKVKWFLLLYIVCFGGGIAIQITLIGIGYILPVMLFLLPLNLSCLLISQYPCPLCGKPVPFFGIFGHRKCDHCGKIMPDEWFDRLGIKRAKRSTIRPVDEWFSNPSVKQEANSAEDSAAKENETTE